jgi:4-hydroxybenzoyl-CoA reductase subunit gamma
MSRLQQAFHEKLGTQCGSCTPGMIMSAEGLLRRDPAPSEAAIREALGGNLCRCTGYVKIIESVQCAFVKDQVSEVRYQSLQRDTCRASESAAATDSCSLIPDP